MSFCYSMLLFLAGSALVRLVAALYPFLMLFAVVASANHFLLDKVAGALTVALAALGALPLERLQCGAFRRRLLSLQRDSVPHGGVMTMYASDLLLRTKLFVSPAPVGLVSRPCLIEILDRATTCADHNTSSCSDITMTPLIGGTP